MVGRVLSQLKPLQFYILSCGKGIGLAASTFSTPKNVELLGLYPMHKFDEMKNGLIIAPHNKDVIRLHLIYYIRILIVICICSL